MKKLLLSTLSVLFFVSKLADIANLTCGDHVIPR